MTRAGHCQHDKCDVYVGRGSIWGNPFVQPGKAQWSYHRVTEVENPLTEYEKLVRGSPAMLATLRRLKGKTLGCYCVRASNPQPAQADEVCHAQILVRLVEEFVKE